MLEEDFEEERFFATVRRAYWQRRPDAGAQVADAGRSWNSARRDVPALLESSCEF